MALRHTCAVMDAKVGDPVAKLVLLVFADNAGGSGGANDDRFQLDGRLRQRAMDVAEIDYEEFSRVMEYVCGKGFVLRHKDGVCELWVP